MKKIAEGTLNNKSYVVRHLSTADLSAIETLQAKVYASLEDQSVLQPLTTEEFNEILHQEKMMIGVFVQDQLIGFRALLEPPIDEEHLGYDCQIDEEAFSRVLYQEISNVAPEYRGFGLQRKMAAWSMAQIDEEKYDYICSTVKPGNIPSLKDKFSQGLIVRALKIKYVDKLRYVFFKDLRNSAPNYTEIIEIDMNDIEGQQSLLKEGYVGTKLEKKADQWLVLYEK
ncbi:MAG: GNAT family N-acetyltransferase [Kurthia sp.]